MLRIFSLYGKVVEVVIPPKRDKMGRQFGFVRFKEVREPEYFATKLDNIIIGSTKLHVNIPRFSRESYRDNHVPSRTSKPPVADARNGDMKQGSAKDVKGKGIAKDEPHPWKKSNQEAGNHGEERGAEGSHDQRKVSSEDRHFVRDEGRYNVGRGNRRPWMRRKRPLRDRFKGLLCYDISEEEMDRFRKMYVGYVKQPGTSYRVQDWFSMQGVFSVKITPIGANSVLLEDIEEGALEDLVNYAKDWMYEWFDDIRKWEPDVSDNERLVWVRCHGVPTHAWGEGICKLMANTMGSYVDIDEDTRKKTTLDIARILIRTRHFGTINRVFHITISGEVFPIKIMEEWCGPLRHSVIPKDLLIQYNEDDEGVSSESEESGDSDGDFDSGPPLFQPEEVGEPVEEGEVGETPRQNDDSVLFHAKRVDERDIPEENTAD